MREQNLKLEKEIDFLKDMLKVGPKYNSQFKQITTENSKENYQEKRMNTLKSQVMQLQRQVKPCLRTQYSKVVLLSSNIHERQDLVCELASDLFKLQDMIQDGRSSLPEGKPEYVMRWCISVQNKIQKLQRSSAGSSMSKILTKI